MTKRLIILSILLVLYLSACVGTAPEVASEPPPEAAESSASEPTASSSETSATESDWLNNYGKTADNRVYLGNPDAPVTMIDYSDFM